MTARNGDGSGSDGDGRKTITRRRMLLGGASLGVVGAGRAIHNTVLGYGQFGMGTNLKEQDIAPIAAERLRATYHESIDGTDVRLDGDVITVSGDERLDLGADSPAAAAGLDSALGLDGRLEAVFDDVSAIRSSAYAFEFHDPAAFFDRLERAETRPEAVTAVRSNRDRAVDPAIVERFAGADPADPAAILYGLVDGFREHTSYDVPRYLAGSIEDNVIFGARDLRQQFEDDVGFRALLEADETGIFCWELVFRSIEALQAVSADRQSSPIAACYVSDRRHKHAYTGLLSAVAEDDGLRFPMTFVDYTYSTLYDDFSVRGLLGEGLAAYDDSHRASEMYW